MDKLWSPWRSNYIQSFKHKNENNECVFCSAPQLDINDDKSLVIYKSKFCFAMMNLYPYNGGHLMVIPYRHLSDIDDLSLEEFADITAVLKSIKKALVKMMKPQGFNIGANIGKAAGAGIDQHIHFHILPRWVGDTNFMPALGEVKVISQDLLEMKKELVEIISKM
jgi:ATP adenylyltransferase